MIKLEVVVILFFRAHKVTIIFHIIGINMLYFMLFNIKYLDIAILRKSSRNFFRGNSCMFKKSSYLCIAFNEKHF
ncbi:hypothetical protein D7Y07_14395 [Bacteroides acidifaciens]|uniref:Uncharacterized protein n=1 Tax=Bacteroides acidifaciens TaxID=85831 RepID=A0A3L8A624_9BACE|nr:hypothetical protein D7Y07_14395 [Bacteroides acidifaciens]